VDRTAPARRRPARRGLPAALVLGAVAVTGFVPHVDVQGAYRPPFAYDKDLYLRSGFSSFTGVVGIGLVNQVEPTGPFVLTGARPAHVDAGLEVLGVRAVFWTNGTTRSGYRASPGAITIGCTHHWPPTGWGPSYPVEGLRLDRGDPVTFIVYVRSSLPGVRIASGLRIDYALPNGTRRSFVISSGIIELTLYREDVVGSAYRADAWCPAHDDDWTSPFPGFPS
jgi:hypothetical protein